MKKTTLKFFLVLSLVVSGFVPFLVNVPKVSAKNLLCDIFPFINNFSAFGINSICKSTSDTTGQNALSSVIQLAQLLLSFIFVAIIIVSIYIIIKAAFTYIRSEGDDAKIQDAQKAIKSVFAGIAALFVGVIGIVIILAIFGSTGALSVNNTDIINNIIKKK